jgi:hypothetical protein
MAEIISNRQQKRSQQRRRGQSLVEFALTMPVLLVIVAGVLEVGNLLTHYNRTVVAAREGARFGAAGGTDTGIRTVVEQAAEDSLRIDPDQMTVWAIRPVVDTGTSPWSWKNGDAGNPWGVDVNCIYGNSCGSLDLDPGVVMQDIIQIGTQPIHATIDGKTIVVVVVRYDTDTILNLNFFSPSDQPNGRVPIWAYSALVQEIDQSTINQLSEGCSSYSLAIERHWLAGLSEGDRFGGDGSGLQLNDLFDPAHRENFGFTAWRIDTLQPSNVSGQGVSCEVPIGSGHIEHGGPCASMFPPGTSLRSDLGFWEYDSSYGTSDPPDTTMHRGDWVLASIESTVATANQPLIDHEESGRAIRIIVYDYEVDGVIPVNPGYHSFNGGGEFWQYRIDDFAIVKVIDHREGSSPTHDWLELEFVRWDNSCGVE